MSKDSLTPLNLPLGKDTRYPETYNPDLLQGVPRLTGRSNLAMVEVPDFGADIWNLYEMSWLNANGLPQVATGRVTIDSHSNNLIESKSFKLYLNSLNQMNFSDWNELQNTVVKDLENCAEGAVSLELCTIDDLSAHTIGTLHGECIDHQDIKIGDYSFNEKYLENAITTEKTEETLVSHLLKSNCLITNQPDWGSVQIKYKGSKINKENLLRYFKIYCLFPPA